MNLKELSAMLGLSQTTISRALNGYPEVAEATRQRVADAAASHGYRPNHRARSLATGRAMAIGHVIPVSRQHELVNPIFADFMSGAGEAYSHAGYEMMISLVADDAEARAYRDIALRGNIDGLILHGPRMEDPRIAMLAKLRLPFVVHGRASAVSTPHSWLDVDNRRAITKATAHLIALGHERIALINGLSGFDYAWRRESGYRDAMAAADLPILPEHVTNGAMTEPYGFHSATAMLQGHTPPTAFVAGSSIVALGVRRACQAAGLSIGSEVSIICFDDDISYLRDNDGPPVFTALRSSVREAGARAAKMLLSQIEAPDTPPQSALMEAVFVPGQSTGPRPNIQQTASDTLERPAKAPYEAR